MDSSTSALKENQELLDDYQADYHSYIEQQLFAKGYGDELTEYINAVQEYNSALLSGDASEIEKAKQEYEKIAEIKDSIVAKNNDFSMIFDTAQIDEATKKYRDFQEVLTKTNLEKDNQFAETKDKLQSEAERLKEFGLSEFDAKQVWFTDSEVYQDGKVQLRNLMNAYGVDTESQADVESFIDILAEVGIVASDTTEEIEEEAKTVSKSFADIFDSADFADTKEKLLKLAKSGELSEKTLESTEEYAELIKQTGLSAEEAKNKILDMLAPTQKLSAASQGLEKLKSAYQEFKDEDIGFVTAETLESLPDAFKDLESFDLFSKIVGNPESGVQKIQEAFNKITTEYIATQGTLSNILNASDSELQTFIANFEQMGITNAKEVIKNLCTTTSAYNTMLAKTETAYNTYLYTKAENDKTYFNDLVENNRKAILEQFGQDYLDDYDNWCKTLEAKASAYNEYISEYMKGYEQQKALGNTLATPDPFWQEYYNLGGGKDVPLLNVNYGKKLDLNFGDSDFHFDSSDLTSGDKSSSKSKTEESFDWIEVAVEQIERTIDNLDKTVEATYLKWTTRNSALKQELSKVSEEITLQKQAYSKYMSLADSVGLSSHYKNLVQNGAIKYETITDENLAKKIKKYEEFYNLAIKSQDVIQDLQGQLAELARTKFDNIAKEFENNASLIEHESTMLESYADSLEKQGYMVTASIYDSLIQNEQKKLELLKAKGDELTAAMNSDNIEKYSEEWYSMQLEILGVAEEIQSVKNTIIDFENELRELDWTAFDKLQEKISAITEEADFLIELMSDEKMFDDNGNITEHGQAILGLHSMNYNVYISQAEEYQQALLQLNDELANDPNNQILIDRKNELLQLQRESILSAENEVQTIKDLKSQGYDALLSAMDKSIQKRKDALQQIKTLRDYEKTISKQVDEVARLEKMTQSMKFDESEEGRATLQKYQVQLEQAKEDLQETQLDKMLQEEEKMLNALQEEAQSWVNIRLDDLSGLLQSAIDSTNVNADSIGETLRNETDKVGIMLTDKMDSIWSNDGIFASTVAMYGDDFASQLTTTNDILTSIKDEIAGMVSDSEKKANDQTSSGNSSSSSTGKESSSSNTSSNTGNNTSTGNSTTVSHSWESALVHSEYKGDKSKLDTKSSITDLLKSHDYDASFEQRAKLYKAMNGSGVYSGSSSQNQYMLKIMKDAGYKKGSRSIPEDKMSWIHEDEVVFRKSDGAMLMPLNSGDTVFNKDMVGGLWNLAKEEELPLDVIQPLNPLTASLNNLDHLPKTTLPNTTPKQNVTNISFGDIQMHGVNDPKTFAKQLKHELLYNHDIVNIIQADTIGAMLGKNSFTIFRYK